MNITAPLEVIQSKIFLIRGKKVMLDNDLAELYGVETKQLKRAVKRNIERFPEDFMFELNINEYQNLRYQFGTSSWGGKRYLPYAFTEHGVLMLSSVLNSPRAVQVNIQIMRVFNKLRELLMNYKDLNDKIAAMECKYDNQFKSVFDAIKLLIENDIQLNRRLSYDDEKQQNKQFGFIPKTSHKSHN